MTNPPAEDILSKMEGKAADVTNGDVGVDDDFQREMFLWVLNHGRGCLGNAILLAYGLEVLWFGLHVTSAGVLVSHFTLKSPVLHVSDSVSSEALSDNANMLLSPIWWVAVSFCWHSATVKLKQRSSQRCLCWTNMASPPRGLMTTLQKWPRQTSTCKRWDFFFLILFYLFIFASLIEIKFLTLESHTIKQTNCLLFPD